MCSYVWDDVADCANQTILVCMQAEELDKKLRHIVEDLPDREYKRMGSMAGANSRTFDTYRRDKRREQERLKMLEQEEREEERKRKFQVCGMSECCRCEMNLNEVCGCVQESMETKNQIEDAKTAARRAKRLKQKV